MAAIRHQGSITKCVEVIKTLFKDNKIPDEYGVRRMNTILSYIRILASGESLGDLAFEAIVHACVLCLLDTPELKLESKVFKDFKLSEEQRKVKYPVASKVFDDVITSKDPDPQLKELTFELIDYIFKSDKDNEMVMPKWKLIPRDAWYLETFEVYAIHRYMKHAANAGFPSVCPSTPKLRPRSMKEIDEIVRHRNRDKKIECVFDYFYDYYLSMAMLSYDENLMITLERRKITFAVELILPMSYVGPGRAELGGVSIGKQVESKSSAPAASIRVPPLPMPSLPIPCAAPAPCVAPCTAPVPCAAPCTAPSPCAAPSL